MRMVFNAAFFLMHFLQLFVLSWNANEILLEVCIFHENYKKKDSINI